MKSYQPTKAELDAHTFKYDASAVDQALVDFLQHFYALSDSKTHPDAWAACFSENATMVRKTASVTGRDEIEKINRGSWEGQASRLHIAYSIYPLQAGKPEEIMVLGMSKYWNEDASTGQMPWSARLCFNRSSNSISIDRYEVYSGMLKQPADS